MPRPGSPGCAPSDFWNYPYTRIERPLWPWDEIESSRGFDGTLYTSGGASYAAPTGDYTIVATFTAVSAESTGGISNTVTYCASPPSSYDGTAPR